MKQTRYRNNSILLLLLLTIFCGNIAIFGQGKTIAGTEITNSAEGIYKNKEGELLRAVSPLVRLTVKAISALNVTPDNENPTEVIAANEIIVRKYQVCNTSNSADTYTITQASVNAPSQIAALYYDIDNDEVITANDVAINLNNTQSPTIQPGECINILVEINTNNISLNDLLTSSITARSNLADSANGIATDSGTIIDSTGKNAILTDPNNPTLVPLKTVENTSTYVSSKNEPLDYQITFKNSGDVAAKNVILTDDLPIQLTYIANTLRVNNASVSDPDDTDEGSVVGNRLLVKFANPIASGEIITINFQALINNNNISGQGIINTARIAGSNAAAVETTQAITVIDPFGIVYAARGGSGSPISGAKVVISTDPNVETPLQIPANLGFEPNLANTNPYLTTVQGRYSFALRPDQLGSAAQPAVYYVMVTAENFRSRLIQISLEPNGNGLFRMTVHALDGLPLATAGGFDLVQNDVDIQSIADVAFNIPMFESSTLELTKTVDRIQAEIGDVVNYRVELHNASVAPLLDVVVNDSLPDSFNFAENSAEVLRGGTAESIVPLQNGRVLHFRIGTLASGERISLTYRVRIGVNARNGESFNQAVGSGTFPSGETVQTTIVRAGLRINAGMFSMKQMIIGRVFIDDNGNNLFENGERPVVGARVYLANGESAITDSQGLYNLPAISEGAQVIAIDPITIPQGFLLQDNNSYSGKRWSRLLRTPLGGGGMLRQNFALVVSRDPISDVESGKLQKDTENSRDILKEMQASNAANNPKVENEFKPVAPGEVVIHSYPDNSVVMSAAANLEISVAQNSKVLLEINKQLVSNQNIGTTREDRKNQITTYTFIGLGMKPGPNNVSATSISPEGMVGKAINLTLYGRGSAKTLEILSDSKELQASGRDSTRIFVKALDAWSHPAQDLPVMIKTSAGRLIQEEEYSNNQKSAQANRVVISQNARSTAGVASEQENAVTQEQQITLKDGIGVIKLISDSKIGTAEIKASTGLVEADTQIQFISEVRPGMLVSVAEVTVGKAAPEMQNRGVDENVRSHVQFFYRGGLFTSKNMLTLAYDSQQPLNRLAGKDRLFQLNPLDRVYPIFGDNSTRFQETESNSKIYARFDRGRSYAMFGDFTANMEKSRLLNYGRKLTGVKLHLENSNGDFISATGARPNTSFARQIISGGTLGIVQLGFPDILPGSEYFAIETRDRRSPDVILSRETLTRGLDYNIDTSTGTIFFLRAIPTFDRDLNLVQIVATYEYRSQGIESAVYTGRASKSFNRLGLRLGASYLDQRQANSRPFRLGGIDLSLKLPKNGKLEAEYAMSRGEINNGFSFFNNALNGNRHDGDAFFLHIQQPLGVRLGELRFEGSHASEGFYNPFGATVTPGNTRGNLIWESKPLKNGTLKVNLVGEKNETENVDNTRVTAGANWTQTINEKIKVNFGYDFRRFNDSKNEKSVSSNLVSFGAEYRPIEKLDFSIKREQNLGEADPSYPNQTTLQANYRVNNWSKLFFTQRLSSAAITPISDVVGTGFAFSKARNETAIGVETQFGKYTSMSGRYQLENGINGTDSFAILGLQNRLPVSKVVSVDLGFERAFHLKGNGQSYNNFVIGANYVPTDNFRTSVRYELRDREGFGQVLSFAAAGQFKPGWTTMGRFQHGDISFNDRKNKVSDGQVALAIRPHDTDKYGLLFAYTHQNSYFSSGTTAVPTQLKTDVVSADGFHQTTKRLELYGRFALKFSGDANTNLKYSNNLTYLTQGRAQYQLTRYFDVAGEARYLFQPTTGSQKRWLGVEAGFWATPDLRIGGGYNFSKAQEPFGFNNNNLFNKNGFYFVVSAKMSRIFNLFGTKKEGLQYVSEKDGLVDKKEVRK